MLDLASQRAMMVATQVRTNDVTDGRVRAAMASVPRELFVPGALREVAYVESCIPLGGGRSLLDARTLAKLLQLAAIGSGEHVLDVGCGTGYSAAVLGLLAGRVTALEVDAGLAELAERNLNALNLGAIEVIRGALVQGCARQAPFDAILLNGAIEIEPATLLGQLREGGRLVCVVREGGAGHARLYVKQDGAIGHRKAFDAQVPILAGFGASLGFVF